MISIFVQVIFGVFSKLPCLISARLLEPQGQRAGLLPAGPTDFAVIRCCSTPANIIASSAPPRVQFTPVTSIRMFDFLPSCCPSFTIIQSSKINGLMRLRVSSACQKGHDGFICSGFEATVNAEPALQLDWGYCIGVLIIHTCHMFTSSPPFLLSFSCNAVSALLSDS